MAAAGLIAQGQAIGALDQCREGGAGAADGHRGVRRGRHRHCAAAAAGRGAGARGAHAT